MAYPLRQCCASGHRFTPANTAISATGARICLACKRRQDRLWLRARRARARTGLHATVSCTCGFCGRVFKPRRANPDGYCSQDCRDASAGTQQPGRWALVVWQETGDMRSRFAFFDTRAAAVAAAPPAVPFTVVDRTVTAARAHPSPEEVLKACLARRTRAV
jgi:hypothetical protein